MTKQARQYSSGEISPRRMRYKKMTRVGLLATVATVAMAAVSSWMVASGHDNPEFNIFTLGVGEQGSTTAYWAPGSEVNYTTLKELQDCETCSVEILVPAEYADAIRRTFEQIDDYENVESPKVLRIVVVIGGSSAKASDGHWHGPLYHSHSN